MGGMFVAAASIGTWQSRLVRCPSPARMIEYLPFRRSAGVRCIPCFDSALAGPACLNNNAPLRRGRSYVLNRQAIPN